MIPKGVIYLVAHRDRRDPSPNPPYGILYIGQALRQAGYQVRAFHLFGDQDRLLLDAVNEQRPLFVGFSNFLSRLLIHQIRLSRQVQALGLPTVWGGIYATVCPELVLAEDYVDYIVQGEGEEVAPLLADAIANGVLPEGIPGVGFKRGGERVLAAEQPQPLPDLDRFPPAWDLIDLDSYAIPMPGKDGRFFNFFVSRGCPCRCSFCYNLSDPARSQWRIHSPAYCREELGYVHRRLGLKYVHLMGDNPFIYPQPGQAVAAAVEELGLCWSSVLQVQTARDEFAQWLKQSQCFALGIGVESGSDRMLKLLHKGFTAEQVRECFERLAAAEVELWPGWIFFAPDETEADRQLSYALMAELLRLNPRTHLGVSWFKPYPQTPIWQRCLELGWQPPRNSEAWANLLQQPESAPFSPWSAARRHRLAWDLPVLYRQLPTDYGPLIKRLLRLRVREGSFRLPLEEIASFGHKLIKGISAK